MNRIYHFSTTGRAIEPENTPDSAWALQESNLRPPACRAGDGVAPGSPESAESQATSQYFNKDSDGVVPQNTLASTKYLPRPCPHCGEPTTGSRWCSDSCFRAEDLYDLPHYEGNDR